MGIFWSHTRQLNAWYDIAFRLSLQIICSFLFLWLQGISRKDKAYENISNLTISMFQIHSCILTNQIYYGFISHFIEILHEAMMLRNLIIFFIIFSFPDYNIQNINNFFEWPRCLDTTEILECVEFCLNEAIKMF